MSASSPDPGEAGAGRCPSCGGLVAPGAEWCGQCYAPLSRDGSSAEPASRAPDLPGAPAAGVGDLDDASLPAPPKAPGPVAAGSVATPGGGAVEVSEGTAAWDCPVCGERNPIDADRCRLCETPFSRLFEQPVSRPEIEPATAALWSLAFAGLGHWKAGYRAEGFARAVLFAWTLGTVLVVLVSRPDEGGFGRGFPLFALYAASAAAVYAISAVDAFRVAGGDAPMVSSRTLVWASAGLVLVSIVLAMFVTLPATGG